MAVPDPSIVGFGGGAKLSEHSENPSEWDTKTEAFGVAVMHQVHCVVSGFLICNDRQYLRGPMNL